jgi:hypothetical protein
MAYIRQNKCFYMNREIGKSRTVHSAQCIIVLIITAFLSGSLHSCGPQRSVSTTASNSASRKLLLRDEGLSKLSYIDVSNTQANWYVSVPPGRDIQLVGAGRVLIGTGTGYEEREIATGTKSHELTSFDGTISARRLRNGNTLLVGLNWQGQQGIVLVEVDGNGSVKRTINYPDFKYVRLVRETPSGTFMVTANETIFEGSGDGSILWRAKLMGRENPHSWQALRLADGKTIVSGGYTAKFHVFGKDGNLLDTITGPPHVKPNFFAGFQILANGDLVVTNWQGHGDKFGASGIQLLEYKPDGSLAWSWQQDASKFSSLQGVIVLDGLDLNLLHIEDANGKLAPVKAK